jgi:cysteinyl-tRNA synthetase
VLGLPIDIHGGGHDLIFPHHTNEIAQSCAAHGAKDAAEYARYWMHNGFLDMSGEKMSKSLGNVVLVHDLVKQYPGEVIRWALLSGHYRSPLDWTPELLEQSRKNLDGLYQALRDANALLHNARPQLDERSLEFYGEQYREQVLDALSDDLNTPAALGALFMNELRGAILQAKSLSGGSTDKKAVLIAKNGLIAAGALLGVLQQDPDAWFEGGADDDLKAKVEALIAERIAARAAKDFAAADRIRDQLNALNIVVMDSPAGATWRMKD